MGMTLVPEEFVLRMPELYGRNGDEWVKTLPELLDECMLRFGIVLESARSNLSWNLVLNAKANDGTPVVLKLGVGKDELAREARVLKAYAGDGAVRVLDYDNHLGALLLERVQPGTPLSEIEDDNVATELFCNLFSRLHSRPLTGTYPPIEEHFLGIHRYRNLCNDGAPGLLPAQLVDRAEECLAYLIPSMTENVLLHGDLHHDNILRQVGEEWIVIDPKGIVGDRHFDVIQYLLNYVDRGGSADTVLERRVGIISDRLNLDPHRIAMWGIAKGVLDACWAIEDGGEDWNTGIQTAVRFEYYLARNA